jgi:hypothetical protein
MQSWEKMEGGGTREISPKGQKVVIWVHDESIFYANDHRCTRWVHKDETAKPWAKGEGISMMVADFVSADYGWLRSPDGKEKARVIFRPGKERDGYFDLEDVVRQAKVAMEILTKYYPNEDYVFIYDNMTTHLKHADNALSALKIPKLPPKKGQWGLQITVIGPDGKKQKKWSGCRTDFSMEYSSRCTSLMITSWQVSAKKCDKSLLSMVWSKKPS